MADNRAEFSRAIKRFDEYGGQSGATNGQTFGWLVIVFYFSHYVTVQQCTRPDQK